MPRNLVVLELFAQPLPENLQGQFGDGEQHRFRTLCARRQYRGRVDSGYSQCGGLDLGRADPEPSRLIDVVASPDKIQVAVVVEIPVVTAVQLDEKVVDAME